MKSVRNVRTRCMVSWADPERVQGVRTTPPEKSLKNIEFLSNTCPDPLKITKLPSQHSMLGTIMDPPAKRHLNGASLAGP